MEKSISLEHHYNHPIKEVWDAITLEKNISAWFIKADFKAEEGYDYTFTHEDTTITGKVLQVNPTFDLTYTWIVGGTGVETTVKWTLTESDEGTLLKLEHTGIENYPTEELSIKMFEGFTSGWNSCLVNLDKYLINA